LASTASRERPSILFTLFFLLASTFAFQDFLIGFVFNPADGETIGNGETALSSENELFKKYHKAMVIASKDNSTK